MLAHPVPLRSACRWLCALAMGSGLCGCSADRFWAPRPAAPNLADRLREAPLPIVSIRPIAKDFERVPWPEINRAVGLEAVMYLVAIPEIIVTAAGIVGTYWMQRAEPPPPGFYDPARRTAVALVTTLQEEGIACVLRDDDVREADIADLRDVQDDGLVLVLRATRLLLRITEPLDPEGTGELPSRHDLVIEVRAALWDLTSEELLWCSEAVSSSRRFAMPGTLLFVQDVEDYTEAEIDLWSRLCESMSAPLAAQVASDLLGRQRAVEAPEATETEWCVAAPSATAPARP